MGVVAEIFPPADDAVYHDGIVEVEANGKEVDLHLDAGQPGVMTATLSIEAAWSLIRQMSRAVAEAERDAV